MSILDIWKTVVVPIGEEGETIKKIEAEGTHRWAAAASGPHVGEGLVRLTFLPHGAFVDAITPQKDPTP